ncbi:MAG TPA: tetratricopeptide repeat protein, partial [Sphingomicrobium sp.]|nr:tetratricopeptide repeat protein [Sphingomicrobium sp.]
MNFERAIIAARASVDDEDALSTLARIALEEAREEDALPLLRRAAEGGSSALLWQWTGLLERAIDEHQRALYSFARASALAPADRSIAHGRARVALEAGIPAEQLFEDALRVSPGDPDVVLGYSAALFAAGKAEAAERTLAYILERSPLWIEGHTQLAQLRSTIGKKDRATASIEQSLQLYPRAEELWAALFRLLLQMQNFRALDEAIARARSHAQPAQTLARYEAIAAIEQDQTDRADRLLAAMSSQLRQSIALWTIRHLLRAGRLQEASSAIAAALQTELAADVWPYASIAWRLTGDHRLAWLEGNLDQLVSVIDLSSELPDLNELEMVLRKLHAGKGEYLDQSVRGGSQTDGPLFPNIDPRIRALRGAIVSAVRHHLEQLPERQRG